MGAWIEGRRDDPKHCREQDEGFFEIIGRDGRARLGRLHTKHGILETPALLPVINPNIRTIEPREMWDRYGIGALITNSYIIWKHDELKQKATTDGVHALLDFPGVVMTDSGTFQSYIYGDVEVGVEQIVQFQNSIGVDIATMLDVFSRPDMTHAQVEHCVDETLARAPPSIAAAGSTMLNGPIQGGLFRDLRTKSAKGMAEFNFAVHPIGGIVPVMEQHKYKDYAKIMLSTLPYLPAERPVHMFGCGHPMLFPMSIALGADLFDSAAYALFARDGRLLTPWGTERIESMVDWPMMMPCVASIAPQQVRSMPKDERTALLARYNLEMTLSELSRCKQAIRDGTLWRLVERRSHQHPSLREAFLWLSTRPQQAMMKMKMLDDLILNDRDAGRERGREAGAWEEGWNWLVHAQESPRKGGEPWGGEDTFVRPHIVAGRRQLIDRWTPSGAKGKGEESVLIMHGSPGPWRERLSDVMVRLTHHCPGLEVLILTPVGLVPYSLEDLNPFAHIDGPEWLWRRRPNLQWIRREMDRLGLGERTIVTVDMVGDGIQARCMTALHEAGVIDGVDDASASDSQLDKDGRDVAKSLIYRRLVSDKLTVLLNVDPEQAKTMLDDATFVVNRHGRVKNAKTGGGLHIASPRLGDGGLSLTDDGAMMLHQLRAIPAPSDLPTVGGHGESGTGPAWVVVDNDAEPFVRQGRNVFYGFIVAVDPWIKPSQTCLIVNQSGDLLGHGLSNGTADEFAGFKKGIAVKTRGGISL
jgi:7-cyano-7-deazaguanine tRNA-ribosyltransferase